MLRALKALGIAVICLGFVVAGVAMLRANDRAKAEQEAKVRSMFEEAKNIRSAKWRVALVDAEKEEKPVQQSQTVESAPAAAEASKEATATSDLESNRRTIDSVEADDEFAELAETFNRLMDERRFREALAVARGARRLQPSNPVARTMFLKATRAVRDAARQKGRAKAGDNPPSSPEATEKTSASDGVEIDDWLEFNVKLDDPQTMRLMFGVGEGVRLVVPDVEVKDSQLQDANFDIPVRKVAIDPGQREALGQIVEKLKTEATHLERSGLKDEAAQKRIAVESLEKALEGLSQQEITYYLRNGQLHRRALPDERTKIKAFQADLARTGLEIQELLNRKQTLLTAGKEGTAHLDSPDIPAELAAIEREVEVRQKELARSQTVLGDAHRKLKNEFKAFVEKNGDNEVPAAKMELIELLGQTQNLAGEMKQGLPSADYYAKELKRMLRELDMLLAHKVTDPAKAARYRLEVEFMTGIFSARRKAIEKLRTEIPLQADHLEKAGKQDEAEELRKKGTELETVLKEHMEAAAPLLKRAAQVKFEGRQLEIEAMQEKRILLELDSITHSLNADLAARLGAGEAGNQSGSIPGVTPELVGKLQELLRQWKALEGAAEELKEAGLEDQARGMSEASERMRKEFFRIRQALVQETLNARAKNESSDAVARPPIQLAEVHRTLTELREQVQELRKEVGQLKELLEKKQQ